MRTKSRGKKIGENEIEIENEGATKEWVLNCLLGLKSFDLQFEIQTLSATTLNLVLE